MHKLGTAASLATGRILVAGYAEQHCIEAQRQFLVVVTCDTATEINLRIAGGTMLSVLIKPPVGWGLLHAPVSATDDAVKSCARAVKGS